MGVKNGDHHPGGVRAVSMSGGGSAYTWGGSGSSSVDSTTGSCISCTCLMIIFVFLTFGLTVLNLWMHVHRYDELSRRMELFEVELNKTGRPPLPSRISRPSINSPADPSRVSLIQPSSSSKYITEDEIRQNILNWQVDFDLEKQALLREVGYNMTILTKHMQKYSNISSLAKIDSDKAVSLVRNMKQTLGASVDGLSRKFGYFDEFRNRTNEHFEILHDIVTKVKTREDELERTQVANNLYLETLGAEVKTLAEKSRDLQHATEKVKDQLHSTVPADIETTRQELLAVYDDLTERINRMEAIAAALAQKEDQLMIKSEMTATSSITRDELDLAIKRTKQQIIDKLTLSSNNSLSELETRMTRELDQIGLETIEKNMRIEQLINDISTNHTKTSETLDQETARLQEQISENETQLKHFIRIAVKMGKTLPKEIESLKKQVESLGAYF